MDPRIYQKSQIEIGSRPDTLERGRHLGGELDRQRVVGEFDGESARSRLGEAPRDRPRAVEARKGSLIRLDLGGPVPVITARWQQRTARPGSGSRGSGDAHR